MSGGSSVPMDQRLAGFLDRVRKASPNEEAFLRRARELTKEAGQIGSGNISTERCRLLRNALEEVNSEFEFWSLDGARKSYGRDLPEAWDRLGLCVARRGAPPGGLRFPTWKERVATLKQIFNRIPKLARAKAEERKDHSVSVKKDVSALVSKRIDEFAALVVEKEMAEKGLLLAGPVAANLYGFGLWNNEGVRADLVSGVESPRVQQFRTEYCANAHAVEAAVRVLAIHTLLAAAAKRPDYVQNATSERASQVFDQLLRLRDVHLHDLQIALGAAVGYGGLRRKPARVSETPDQ